MQVRTGFGKRAPSGSSASGGSSIGQSLSQSWDKGSRTQRIQLLSNLIQKHSQSTTSELEEDLGPAALLLFTRITTWLRLTYQLGYELSVQLTAISLFLQGQRFVSAFAETGGIQLLTDLLCHTNPKYKEDKRNALLLLIHMANSGRVYRELMCDGGGVGEIMTSANAESDASTLDLYSALFLALGQANPRKALVVHEYLVKLVAEGSEEIGVVAASTLRALQVSRDRAAAQITESATNGPVDPGVVEVSVVGYDESDPTSSKRLLDAYFRLLESDNVSLRFEGGELLTMASRNPSLALSIADGCLNRLDDTDATASGGPPTPAFLRARRAQLACGRVLCMVLMGPLHDTAKATVCQHIEARSGHVALLKFVGLCSSREPSAVDDACRSIRILCTLPATSRGVYSFKGVVDSSRTARYLVDRFGSPLMVEVLDGPTMTDDQVCMLKKALVVESDDEAEVSDHGASDPDAEASGDDQL